jgi:hypothetical protein
MFDVSAVAVSFVSIRFICEIQESLDSSTQKVLEKCIYSCLCWILSVSTFKQSSGRAFPVQFLSLVAPDI